MERTAQVELPVSTLAPTVPTRMKVPRNSEMQFFTSVLTIVKCVKRVFNFYQLTASLRLDPNTPNILQEKNLMKITSIWWTHANFRLHPWHNAICHFVLRKLCNRFEQSNSWNDIMIILLSPKHEEHDASKLLNTFNCKKQNWCNRKRDPERSWKVDHLAVPTTFF